MQSVEAAIFALLALAQQLLRVVQVEAQVVLAVPCCLSHLSKKQEREFLRSHLATALDPPFSHHPPRPSDLETLESRRPLSLALKDFAPRPIGSTAPVAPYLILLWVIQAMVGHVHHQMDDSHHHWPLMIESFQTVRCLDRWP